jgi:hypothetical protein
VAGITPPIEDILVYAMPAWIFACSKAFVRVSARSAKRLAATTAVQKAAVARRNSLNAEPRRVLPASRS